LLVGIAPRQMRLVRGSYRSADGARRRKRAWSVRFSVKGKRFERGLGTRDRRTAEKIAARMVRRTELEAAGVHDPVDLDRARPLVDELCDYATCIRARGVVPQFEHDQIKAVRAFLEFSRASRPADLTLAAASRWLNALADAPRSLSTSSLNGRRHALRRFGAWLVETRRLLFNPFATLKKLNCDTDRRWVRRALTPDEARRLIETARDLPFRALGPGPFARGPGRARGARRGAAHALLYLLAVGTGLRKGELMRLTWECVDLQRGLVRVEARYAKSRKEQRVELAPAILGALRAAKPSTALPSDTVIPPRCFPDSRVFYKELDAAGVARVDAVGKRIDFHALRTTFISWLVMTGTHPRAAQVLARHSRIEHTMRWYTELRPMDLREAVGRLPLPALGPALRWDQSDAAFQGEATRFSRRLLTGAYPARS